MSSYRSVVSLLLVLSGAGCVDQQDLGRDARDASVEGTLDASSEGPGDAGTTHMDDGGASDDDVADGDDVADDDDEGGHVDAATIDGGGDDTLQGDAGSHADGSVPEQAACSPTAPFIISTWNRLPQSGEIDSAQDAWLSPDQLKVYFSESHGSSAFGGLGGVLYEQRRTSEDGAFSGTKMLFTPDPGDQNDVRTDTYGRRPTLSTDLLTLFYINPYGWLMKAQREHESDMFPKPAFVVFDEKSRGDDDPTFALGNSELWFAAQHADVAVIPGLPVPSDKSNYELMRVSLRDSAAVALPVTELNSESDEDSPVLSADGLWIYFRSNRPNSGDMGSFALFEAHRESTSEPFSHVQEVLDLGDAKPYYLSPDYCTLYYEGTGGGVYEARRQR